MAGTFVGLRLTDYSTKILRDYLDKIRLKGTIKDSDLHCTLYYANKYSIEGLESNPEKVYESYVISYGFLGEGEWGALVLHLFSPEMIKRHQHIKTFGSPHSYPEFKPHISLKYKPDPNDIQHLKEFSPLGMDLDFHEEYTEPIEE